MTFSLTTFRNIALAALIGLAACGDDDDSSSSNLDALTPAGVGVDGAATLDSAIQGDAAISSDAQLGADVQSTVDATSGGDAAADTGAIADAGAPADASAAGDTAVTGQDAAPAAPPWVLELPGNSANVDHGAFWPSDTEVGSTWWEAWFSPLSDHLGYVVSDGSGGAHAILVGINAKGAITGNFWYGANKIVFVGSQLDRIVPGEWAHVAVGFERSVEKAIVIYVNGMVSAYQPFDGTRVSSNPKMGAGTLYVGGTTGFHGRIAWVRAFDDDSFPRDPADIFNAFRPSTTPAATEVGSGVLRGTPVTNNTFYADFLASYLLPAGTTTVPDLSIDGVRPAPARMKTSHPGKVVSSATEPLKAAFVQDPTAPFMGNVPQDRPQVPVTALAVPAGAKIFDSFARTNQDFTRTASPTLGRTEAGSLGPLQWQTPADQPFGLRNAHAVFLGSKTLSPAWVDSGSGDHVVQILNAGQAGVTNKAGAAVVFRMSDADNLWAAIISGPFSVTLRKVVNKVATDFGPFPIPTNWTGDISVDAKGSSISVQARRGVGGWLELTKVDDAFNSTATKVGFASASGSYARVKSFLVK